MSIIGRSSNCVSRSLISAAPPTSTKRRARPHGQRELHRRSAQATPKRNEKSASWPVSRVLYGGRSRVTAIPLGHPLPDVSRNPPGRLGVKTRLGLTTPRRPYSVLLPVGFAMPVPLPVPRWALTPPFHPCRDPRTAAVCFLWHFPWGRPRRALPGTVFPWSPDFPLQRPFDPCRSGRPASWHWRICGEDRRGVKLPAGLGPPVARPRSGPKRR